MNRQDLERILDAIGITREMQLSCRMPLYCEEPELVDAGPDLFDRPQRMTAGTLAAWSRMKAAALEQGHELKLVSAYRSVDYQCGLIQRKLDAGQSIENILSVNAIPGYSEHHTGRAIDLHAGDGEPLVESFESEPAFEWLCRHATSYGFVMSYPKGNPEGIDYEPWHWCYQD